MTEEQKAKRKAYLHNYYRTPEYKAQRKADYKKPERKAYREAYYSSPEHKARHAAYVNTPEFKARKKALRNTPEQIAKRKANRQRPEYKARAKKRRSNPEYKAYMKAYTSTPKHKAYLKATTNKLKIEVLNGYGGCRCIHCGDTNISNLSLDHINNDGNLHRKALKDQHGFMGGRGFYKLLIKSGFPAGLCVLCMGCNWAKHRNGGILPPYKKNIYRDALKGRDYSKMNNLSFCLAKLEELDARAQTGNIANLSNK